MKRGSSRRSRPNDAGNLSAQEDTDPFDGSTYLPLHIAYRNSGDTRASQVTCHVLHARGQYGANIVPSEKTQAFTTDTHPFRKGTRIDRRPVTIIVIILLGVIQISLRVA